MKVIMGKTAISLKLWSVNVWKATKKGSLELSTRGITFSLVRILPKQSTCPEWALNVGEKVHA